MDLGLSGLVSGLDWRALVDQLANAERIPQTRLRIEQTDLGKQNTAYAAIQTALEALRTRTQTLNSTALFDTRSATSSDATRSTATAASGTTIGTYSFNVTQLATSAKIVGTSGVGAGLSPSSDVNAITVGNAPLATALTAGVFTVNGRQVTIATTDSLQTVFDNINIATNGEVNVTYDPLTDRINLNSANPIILGSATDTSNFLQATRLTNNGTGNISSATELGVVKMTGALSAANFATPIDDGGAGAGMFRINGVDISFSTADTATAVIKRINDSNAGVTASYDTVNDRFVLANKVTGDIGIALEDVTGNFLAATGLSGGALARGQNLLYTVDGGGQLSSQTNTITETSSGITGLSVTALSTGTSTVTVGSDTATIKTAINDFITEYNKVQSIIDAQTASTTDSKGKVTAGILANEGEADEVARKLRRAVTGEVAGLTAVLNQLEDFGIISNGTDNSIKLDDETKFDKALAENLTTIKNIFADSTNGLAKKLDDYLETVIGDEGSLVTRQTNNTKQSAAIDVQIADLERIVQSNRDRMIQSFIAMETAQANANQQLSFLNQRFGNSSSSSS
jgi:flagellar hook-associated protein 2